MKYIASIFVLLFAVSALAAPPKNNKNVKSKFYIFDEQLIDGERRKPMMLYANSREKVKFKRLLRLKKSFMPTLFKTSRNNVFK
jgi:LEA14-like dessication related protein